MLPPLSPPPLPPPPSPGPLLPLPPLPPPVPPSSPRPPLAPPAPPILPSQPLPSTPTTMVPSSSMLKSDSPLLGIALNTPPPPSPPFIDFRLPSRIAPPLSVTLSAPLPPSPAPTDPPSARPSNPPTSPSHTTMLTSQASGSLWLVALASSLLTFLICGVCLAIWLGVCWLGRVGGWKQMLLKRVRSPDGTATNCNKTNRRSSLDVRQAAQKVGTTAGSAAAIGATFQNGATSSPASTSSTSSSPLTQDNAVTRSPDPSATSSASGATRGTFGSPLACERVMANEILTPIDRAISHTVERNEVRQERRDGREDKEAPPSNRRSQQNRPRCLASSPDKNAAQFRCNMAMVNDQELSRGAPEVSSASSVPGKGCATRPPLVPLNVQAAQRMSAAALNTSGSPRKESARNSARNSARSSARSSARKSSSRKSPAHNSKKLDTERSVERDELKSGRRTACLDDSARGCDVSQEHYLHSDRIAGAACTSANSSAPLSGCVLAHNSSRADLPPVCKDSQKASTLWSPNTAMRWLEGSQALSARSRVLAESRLSNTSALSLQQCEDPPPGLGKRLVRV